MKPEMTSGDVARILNLYPGCVQEWKKKGFIASSIKESGGIRGVKALYGLDDLRRICLFNNLVSRGIRRNLAAALISGADWTDETITLEVGFFAITLDLSLVKTVVNEAIKRNWDVMGGGE